MNFKDHFSTQASEYSQSRPGYPPALFEWLADHSPGRELAWDCATGSGQAALALAGCFDKVIATDASEAQIANAIPHRNVEYRVAPAEASGLEEGRCDLVTAGQALHWFDQEKFHAEVRRVSKPGAFIAAWGYHLTRVSAEIDRVIDVFDASIVGAYWPPERRHIDARYRDLPFPFEARPFPEFDMRLAWNRRQFVAYIATWSSVQRYRKDKGHDPVGWLENELAPFWNADEVREVSWPLFGLAGVVE